MKKTHIVAAVLSLLLVISGCSSSDSATPTQVTTAFLDAYKQRNNALIAQNSTWENYDAAALELREEDYMEGIDQQLQKNVYDRMLAFDHKENSETIDEDRAIVEVTLTMYDFEPVVEKGIEAAATKTEELSKKVSISDEEIQNEILKVLFEHMSKAEQNKTISVSIKLEKKSGEWKVSNDNTELSDALLSNTKAIQTIAK